MIAPTCSNTRPGSDSSLSVLLSLSGPRQLRLVGVDEDTACLNIFWRIAFLGLLQEAHASMYYR